MPQQQQDLWPPAVTATSSSSVRRCSPTAPPTVVKMDQEGRGTRTDGERTRDEGVKEVAERADSPVEGGTSSGSNICCFEELLCGRTSLKFR